MVKTVLKRMWWLVALMALVACNPKNSTPDDGGKDNGGLDNGGDDNGGNDNGGNDNGGNDNGGNDNGGNDNGGNDNGGNDNGGNDNGGNDNGGNDNGGNDNGGNDNVEIGKVDFDFNFIRGEYPIPERMVDGWINIAYTLVPVDRLDDFKLVFNENAQFFSAEQREQAYKSFGGITTDIEVTIFPSTPLKTLSIDMREGGSPHYARLGRASQLIRRGNGIYIASPLKHDFRSWLTTDSDIKSIRLSVGEEFYVMWGLLISTNYLDYEFYMPLNSDHSVAQLDKFFRFRVES
ncbi:hypothetical protein PVA46_06430 [Entomospira culicis]|uniref:hypothetical protein n=1 Tax=Entomospira culicis TaxID=2719989 RepID=UPI002368236D|nr:hypothetical protein [Entomospira culicis]WDI36953.1 hypothetical protein PVA46_06430 [Entomospira culicis]